MQQHKVVEDYLTSVIPTNLTDNKKAELRAEFESHIYDKAEFYIKIGYDEKTAFEKAVDEMGETESIKESFEVIYKDSYFKAVLLFLGLCTANLLSVMVGFGYFLLPDPPMYSLPSIAFLFIYLCGFVLITIYSVKCYRQSLYKQLAGITSAMGLISLCSLIISGLFFPIVNAGGLVFRFITNNPNRESDFILYFINILFLGFFTSTCFIALNKPSGFKKKKPFLSIKRLTILLTVVSTIFLVLYGFAYEKYERWWPYETKEEWYEETPATNYLSPVTTDQKQVYDTIQVGEDIKEIENELIQKGFVKQETDYEEYIWDCLFPYYARDYLLNQLSENLNNNQYSIYCYTYCMEDKEYDYDDVVGCIILSYDNNNEVNYKMFIPDANGMNFDRMYKNYKHGNEAKTWFENLTTGDNIKDALTFIKTTDAFIIEEEKGYDKRTISIYKIYLNCYYDLDVNFIDFLFDRYPKDVSYYYDFTFKAENGKITEGTMCDYGTNPVFADNPSQQSIKSN